MVAPGQQVVDAASGMVGDSGDGVPQPSLGGNPLFETEPDLRVIREGRVEIVIDTKWKRIADRAVDRKMEVAQGDLYQLMAYARLYECDRLVLLYPHHAGLVSAMPAHHRVARIDGEVRLTIATVDLTSHDTARAALSDLVGAPAHSTTG